ncbi:hypothetical protein MTP10_30635 [Nonomuraea sp. 3-1Str]|uniref:hypothetical protein n=1 Tax=Nonomuraea sp. 3-1Str TaxID=2929801 RepID=UPI002858508F|nr:hypothetical protein [Nonomuraea sp. 3-1Str]MDR8413076.1 hypothetical protein [Nonomuraea sp. 3-1Str]
MRRRRPSPPLTVALLLVTALLLSWTVPGIGPALRLAGGAGRSGTFTAQRLDCVRHPGHESCAWTGDFRSHDGVVRRTGVTLAGSDRDTDHVGRQTEAIDVGLPNRVYGPHGSNEWIFTVFLLLAELALLAFALAPVVGAVRRGLASRRGSGGSSRGTSGGGVELESERT